MYTIDKEIKTTSDTISKNIEMLSDNRGLLSQNILSQLRTLVERIAVKCWKSNSDISATYPNIQEALSFIKTQGKLKFLREFHQFLQITTSHYTLEDEDSERLMLKYHTYLLQIKKFLKDEFSLYILENVNKFPLEVDSNLNEYYEKISIKVNFENGLSQKDIYNDRYYIYKVKPFIVNNEVYYEVTLMIASDNSSKFDRIIAFTKIDLLHNYAVKLSIRNDMIDILGKTMPIKIIENWEVSIRPCEIDNFVKIFGSINTPSKNTTEFRNLMLFLTHSKMNLVELISIADNYYIQIKNRVLKGAKVSYIFDVLDQCRDLRMSKKQGSNVICYLLYKLNNKIIKMQFDSENKNSMLSGLNLKYGCIPFDKIPFNTSLIKHNPRLSSLINSLDFSNREDELFARFIKNNAEMKNMLFTNKDEIKVENIQNYIDKYNDKIYSKHTGRYLKNFKNHVYIDEYVSDSFEVIQKISELTKKGVDNYINSVDFWLGFGTYNIDCCEKKIFYGIFLLTQRLR